MPGNTLKILLQIAFVVIFVKFAVCTTITRTVTTIDANGNKHVWTRTTEDPDDNEGKLFSPFQDNDGENFRLKPDTVERRFSSSIPSSDDIMKEAAVVKGMDPDAIDELLKTRQPIVKTIVDRNGNTRTTTYSIEPNGSISRKIVTSRKFSTGSPNNFNKNIFDLDDENENKLPKVPVTETRPQLDNSFKRKKFDFGNLDNFFSSSDFDWTLDISTTTRKPDSEWLWQPINRPAITTPKVFDVPSTFFDSEPGKKSDDDENVFERRTKPKEVNETDLPDASKSNPWLYTPPNYVYTNKNPPKFDEDINKDDNQITTTPKTSEYPDIPTTTKKLPSLKELINSLYETTTSKQQQDRQLTTTTTPASDVSVQSSKEYDSNFKPADLPRRNTFNNNEPTEKKFLHDIPTFMQPVDSTAINTRTIKIENISPTDYLPIDKTTFDMVPTMHTTNTNQHTVRLYPRVATVEPIFPAYNTRTYTTTSNIGSRTPEPTLVRKTFDDPINEFLAKVELSTGDLIAKGGEFSKVITDDNGNILTATFLLSSVRNSNENAGRKTNQYQPIK